MYMKNNRFNQKEYIAEYNKNNYKMYQFRVKKDSPIVDILDKKSNKNKYIVSLIENREKINVLSLKQIKKIIKPILHKYGIKDINLFGSYARGEASADSDIDIYCDKGKIKDLIEQGQLIDELEGALNKKVDLVLSSSEMNDFFKEQIMEDMINLC